jgi:hypothetical protein
VGEDNFPVDHYLFGSESTLRLLSQVLTHISIKNRLSYKGVDVRINLLVPPRGDRFRKKSDC